MLLGIIVSIGYFWIIARDGRWDGYRTWEQIVLILSLVIALVEGGYTVVTTVATK